MFGFGGRKVGDDVAVESPSGERQHGMVVHTHADTAELSIVLLAGSPLAAPEVLPSNSDRVHAYSHAARPKDEGRACDIAPAEADVLTARVREALAGSLPVDAANALLLEELPVFAERALKSRTRTDEDLELIRCILRVLTETCVHFLARHDTPLTQSIQIMLGRVFLDDPKCEYFLQTYGGIRPDHELAKLAAGWAASFPPGGASRFYVSNVNYFWELKGFDHVIARLKAATRASRVAAAAAGEDLASIDAWRPPTGPAPSRAHTLITGALRQASGNPLMVLPYSYQQIPMDDPLYETCTLSNVLYIPRLCVTDDWFARYYLPVRQALLDRVMYLSAAELSRTSWRGVLAIMKNAQKLGEQAVGRCAARIEEIIGEPAPGLPRWFELWAARLDARLALARRFLDERGMRPSAHAAAPSTVADSSAGAAAMVAPAAAAALPAAAGGAHAVL